MVKLLDDHIANYHFTSREMRVVHLALAGLSSKLIGELLSVSPRELANLFTGIQQKIDEHHTQMVIAIARNNGLL